MVLWVFFNVGEHPKAQPAVVLIYNVTAEFSSDRLVVPGIELEIPGYNASDLSSTPRRLLSSQF